MVAFRKTRIGITLCCTLLLTFCGCGEIPLYEETNPATSVVILAATSTTATTTTQTTTATTTKKTTTKKTTTKKPTTKRATTKKTTARVTTTKKSTTTNDAVVTTKKTAENPVVRDGATVYTTPKGKRYHYSATCGGKNSGEADKNTAISAGLTPCQKCAKD